MIPNLLAPYIQEAILFLPRVKRGRDPIRERAIRPIAVTADWRKQRNMWADLRPKCGSHVRKPS